MNNPSSLTKRKKMPEFSLIDSSSSKINNRNSLSQNKNEYIEDIFNNEIKQLESIWNILGITNKYRNNFINYIKGNNILERKDIINEEKISLEKTRELLINLQKEINSREKNIKLLEKYNNNIENYFSEGLPIDINSFAFKKISDIIVELRYNAIKIIDLMSDINKKISPKEEKFDLKKLNTEFCFSPNYLNKMNEDLNFLNNSILNKFIETNELEIDPFLVKYIPMTGNNKNNKLKIPITKEIMDDINRAKNLLVKKINYEAYNDSLKNEAFNNNTSLYSLRNLSSSFSKKRQFSSNPKQRKNTKKNQLYITSNISRELYCQKNELGTKKYNDIFSIKNPLFYHQNKSKKRIKINITNNPRNKQSNNNNIVIERDRIISPVHMKNLLLDEKKKNYLLNNKIDLLKKENNDYRKQNNDFFKLKKNLTDEENKRINAEKDKDILQIKIKELSKKNKQLLDQLSFNDNNISNKNEYDEKIKKLEEKIKNLEEENKKNSGIIEKLLELLNKKDEEIAKLKKENNNSKTSLSNYKTDFYKGNISDFVKAINDNTPLEKIPEYYKKIFSIDESVFTNNYYFSGIFPKLIICKKKDNNNINGVCFLFYENNEDFTKNLTLRIKFIYAIEDLEDTIILMINFIKDNMQFDKLNIGLFTENKVADNQEIIDFLKQKLGFKWLSVDKYEKNNKKCIKLYYERKKNNINLNKNSFFLENYSIITLNNQENDKETNNNGIKFVNYNSLYSLLIRHPELKVEFSDEKKLNELTELNKALSIFMINEYEWNNLEEEKKKIKTKNMNINLEESLFKKLENDNKNIICDIQKKNISINFENNYSIIINDIYYNRIYTDKIKILKENKTNSLFYLIPSKDNTVLFYIGEINDELKKFFENDKNVYEQFLEFHPSSNQKDVTSELKQNVIYIPSFMIQAHLFTNNFNEINKENNISFKNKDEKLYINSFDEYVNIEFRPDENINNSFSVDSIEDQKTNAIMKNDFIIGIFGNDIINDDKLPLIQFLYVNKDNFLTKQNYI